MTSYFLIWNRNSLRRPRIAEATVAIAVKHLDGDPSYFLNADQPLHAAGLIQLPIMDSDRG